MSAQDDWAVVSEEAPTMMQFDTLGESWEGWYLGSKMIANPTPDDPDAEFQQCLFQGTDDEIYGLNPGYDLRNAMEEVPQGSYVRLTYVKDVPTGKPNPMRSFRVEINKSKSR
jgi:hypothetical protein